MSKNPTIIEIQMNIAEITRKAAAKILQTIVQCLAFQRHQIPFPFQTFEKTIKKLKNIQNTVAEQWDSVLIDNQRLLAIQTFDNLNLLLDNLGNLCNITEIDRVMVLFGATIQTVQEAFIIKMPDGFRYSNETDINTDNYQTLAREITVCILGSQKLFELDTKRNRGITNMFVTLHPSKFAKDHSFNGFHYEECLKLPSKCTITEIQLDNTRTVGNDLVLLEQQLKTVNLSGFALLADDNNGTILADTNEKQHPESWYQSNIIVKGFKDNLVKGKCIWLWD